MPRHRDWTSRAVSAQDGIGGQMDFIRRVALISIAHPGFRAQLRRKLAEIRHFTPRG